MKNMATLKWNYYIKKITIREVEFVDSYGIFQKRIYQS